MHVLSLLTAAAVIASGPALAGTIQPVGDFTTDKANDLRGLTIAANGKIYASGHLGTAMAHGLYNSRPIYDYTEEEEKAYWADFRQHVKEMTGKTLKGRLGGGGGYTVRTDDLMAEAGCLYHTSWITDDQPWPINVRSGKKFIFVPYTGQTNDAGMLSWNRDADYYLQMIKDQFDTLYREGAESGRVMCIALHPHNIGRPSAAKYLDEALQYILGHDGVWNTTADDIAEYYIANHYDRVSSWIAERKAGRK